MPHSVRITGLGKTSFTGLPASTSSTIIDPVPGSGASLPRRAPFEHDSAGGGGLDTLPVPVGQPDAWRGLARRNAPRKRRRGQGQRFGRQRGIAQVAESKRAAKVAQFDPHAASLSRLTR
jgi:hypothetical protein